VVLLNEHGAAHELDAVVVRKRPGEPNTLLAIGAAKRVGGGELVRLEHLRDLVATEAGPHPIRLLLFSVPVSHVN
jgi:hypothetical protein